ncbi:hypothetical protein SAMN05518672_105246 [Chitinophaga sp. CF118]|uniref:hypothetical protein n=1 Tax=Chitinophaga sp. CF118 TaxID=1884367 RepID=UPI0008F1999C|nr:hypothetical protein [Chitinophaga sp. CF118]SFE31272.1 hypothetical protein SAMN05518672_105246 [Chitinophaga sp. CF118]
MKRIMLALFLSASIASVSMAQSAQYEGAMAKQVTLLDDPANFTPQKLQEMANTFERIGAAEKTQWLPYYYAGYCNVMVAFMEKDQSKVDVIADKAEANITKADSLSPQNDEIYCIKSLIATSRISVDPPSRGRQYGPQAASMQEQAAQINSENPRVYMLQGQSLFYTPEQFGGSKAGAKAKFETALKKFSTFKPASSIAPHWGETYTKQLLAQIK